MTTQISAYISNETKKSMENYSNTYGIKKAFLIENALNHYLQALHELPSEFIVPVKLVLSDKSFDNVIEMINNPPEPTNELKELMRKNV